MPLDPGRPLDLPFERLRWATARLAEAELHGRRAAVIDKLTAEVAAARAAMTDSRVAAGWTRAEAALDEITTEALLGHQGVDGLVRTTDRGGRRRA